MTQEELFRLRQTGAEVQRILDAEGTMAEQAAAAVGAAESANEAAQQVNDALQEIIETGDIPAATVAKVAEHTVQIGNLEALIFDISANNPTEGHPTPYANLAAAIGEGGSNIPESLRKGGMSVKFIQGTEQSSDNKYVQFRLMADDFSTTVTDWQGVDDEPTAGSDNLVKSGGVEKSIRDIIGNIIANKSVNVNGTEYANTGVTLEDGVTYIIYVQCSTAVDSQATGIWAVSGSTYTEIKLLTAAQFSEGYQTKYTPSGDKVLRVKPGATGTVAIKVWVDSIPATIKQLKDSITNLSSEIAEAEVLQTKEKVDVLYIVRCPNILDVSKAESSSYGSAYKQIRNVEVEGGETYKFFGVYDVSEYAADGSLIIQHKDNSNKWPFYTLNENTRYINVHYKYADFPKPTAIKGVFVGLDNEYGYKEVISTPEFVKQSNNLLGDAQSKFAYAYRYVDGVLTFYSANSRAWDYAEVEEQKSYKYAFDVSSYSNAIVAFYDENKTYISSHVQGSSSAYVFTTPASTKYIRVSANNEANELYVCEFTELETPENSNTTYLKSSIRLSPEVIISPLNNKIWNVMGDSISDYGTGAASLDKYYNLISRKTSCYLRNYGIGGTAITGTSENAMCNRYVNMADNADYITVFGGTNDFGQQIPIGQWGDSDNTTFYGGMKIICEGLINKYIGKKIGFILPLPRYTGSTPVDYSYPNPGLTEYVEAMKDVLKRYSIPYLDLYIESNLAPKFEAVRTAMMPDGLHPNALGHQVIAEKILAFLERL